ncbi:MAG: aspartate kinase [Deltaproteobacteria bacterium]|nr:MAG: aspartate kinase [Deltaproteobacteria bacterium]
MAGARSFSHETTSAPDKNKACLERSKTNRNHALMLIVQKYGGTSVGNAERIQNVAKRVLETQKQGHQVVVVVSAMSGETNRLIDLAHQVSKEPDSREYDQLVSTGEQVTIALLALAIKEIGGKAISYQGHQVRITTDNSYSKARIKKIDADFIRKDLDEGRIVVIAGFQGVDEEGNITTLGRGGSDTTGVAIAAALKADACEIYTDVDGVYTTDPRIVPQAKKIPRISYDEMLELASLGAKVLQIRSVEMAAKYKVPLWVKSSFNNTEGTLVTSEDQQMEDVIISGIAYDKNEAKIAVRRLADKPGIASQLFAPLAESNINIDVIIQNISADGFTDLTFTVPRTDLTKALRIVEKTAKEIGCEKIETDEKIAKVSVVGVGMRSHSGVAAKMFQTLAQEKINIMMISTSEIKISVVIQEADMDRAVKALHKVFIET